MEWLTDVLGGIGGALVTAGSGGILGFLGGIGSAVAKHFQERQRQAWQEKVWAHEERLHDLQRRARAAETEQEIQIIGAQGSMAGLEASIRADAAIPPATGLLQDITSMVRQLFRPVLTIVLLVMSFVMFLQLWGALRGDDNLASRVFQPDEILDLVRYIIISLVFTGSTAALWWFGERAFVPKHLK